MLRTFFFLIGLIFSILFSHCSKYENSSNYGMKTKTTYSSESSISPANTLATLDGNIYSPSSYEYYIKNANASYNYAVCITTPFVKVNIKTSAPPTVVKYLEGYL